MKIYVSKAIVFGLSLSFFAPIVLSSESTGNIEILRISEKNRVSIFMGDSSDTDCDLNGWYAYESANSGIGLLRTQALLAAYQSGQSVTILGSGKCMWPGVEKVDTVDVLIN